MMIAEIMPDSGWTIHVGTMQNGTVAISSGGNTVTLTPRQARELSRAIRRAERIARMNENA